MDSTSLINSFAKAVQKLVWRSTTVSILVTSVQEYLSWILILESNFYRKKTFDSLRNKLFYRRLHGLPFLDTADVWRVFTNKQAHLVSWKRAVIRKRRVPFSNGTDGDSKEHQNWWFTTEPLSEGTFVRGKSVTWYFESQRTADGSGVLFQSRTVKSTHSSDYIRLQGFKAINHGTISWWISFLPTL